MSQQVLEPKQQAFAEVVKWDQCKWGQCKRGQCNELRILGAMFKCEITDLVEPTVPPPAVSCWASATGAGVLVGSESRAEGGTDATKPNGVSLTPHPSLDSRR